MNQRIGIIGGGLAGLYAAWLLEQAGHDYVLLESRKRFGGRLLTVSRDPAGPGEKTGAFDLGATWYWPEMQPELAGLVEELGLQAFPQPEEGDLVLEQQPGQTRRLPGFDGSPPAVRLAGGMESLVQALRSRLRPNRLFTGDGVRALLASPASVSIQTVNGAGQGASFDVGVVLLAVPPRLARATMRFDPRLAGAVSSAWAGTATWMAPHAKYLAAYPEPFWRKQGLSGAARSQTGPLVEVHDASDAEGLAALFGFVGVPAAARVQISEASLRQQCRAQLIRLFGREAGNPLQDWIQDWSREACTATSGDLHAEGHPGQAALQVQEGAWAGRLIGVASEWSTEFPGYIAGAVEAARRGVHRASEMLRPQQ